MQLNEISHPLFIICSKYTDDIFWKQIIKNLAYGITPNGVFIEKNYIRCNLKNKHFSYKIDKQKDMEIIFNELRYIFEHTLNIKSVHGKLQNTIDEQNTRLNTHYDKWNDIKKKSIKELVIELYVLNMKRKYDLSFKQSGELMSTIMAAIMFKYIGPSHIHFNNGNIIKIDGIHFEHKKVYTDKKILL